MTEHARTEGKARNWCFTINNPTPRDDAELFLLKDDCEYMIYQLEQGEGEQTQHYQGTVVFAQQKRFGWMHKRLSRAHLEMTKNLKKSIKYCQKEGVGGRVVGTEVHVYGELPSSSGQGRRTDLEAVHNDLKSGASLQETARNHFAAFAKYGRNIQYAWAMQSEPRNEPTRVFVFIGASGTGKTRAAIERFANPYKTLAFEKRGTVWFDGYEPEFHETIIMDDFYGGIAWSYLLQLCDRYPQPVQTKGGTVQFKPKTIIFTSNSDPRSWYKKMDMAPFYRRLKEFGGFIRFFENNERLLELDADGEAIGAFPVEFTVDVPGAAADRARRAEERAFALTNTVDATSDVPATSEIDSEEQAHVIQAGHAIMQLDHVSGSSGYGGFDLD